MEYEFGMTLTNHRLDPAIETVFLMADGEYSHVSSSLIKQVARFGGAEALKRFVPEELIEPIIAKIGDADRSDLSAGEPIRRARPQRGRRESGSVALSLGDEEVARPLPEAQAAVSERLVQDLEGLERPIEARSS